MKSLLINTFVSTHRQIFAMRTVIPAAFMLAIILMALLLPGTALAGPGNSGR